MIKYIVFVDIDYYPYVEGIYNTLEEAQKAYKDCVRTYSDNESLYLCKIISKKEKK